APAATPVVEWRPESPIQGAVVALSVRPGDSVPASAIVGVDGSVSDQALLFERRDDGSWIAVGGIPIDTRDSLSIPLLVHLAGAVSESLQGSLPVAEGEYRLERLTVAPRFGRPPDSALARRMADESTRARAVSRQALSTPRLWSAPFHRPR